MNKSKKAKACPERSRGVKRQKYNAKVKSSILLFFTFNFLLFTFNLSCFAGSIVNSKHNLSLSGPGKVKGTTETEICVFCHTPHSAVSSAPLWNRYDSGQVYIPYTSTTLKATTGQPAGASKLCLSCHDGTIALGMVRSRSDVIPFTQPIEGEENLGTDLSDDHPVSFRYDSSLAFSNKQLRDPAALTGTIRLDKDSQLQCTSCHDPHDNQFGYFLKTDALRGNLCLTCHNMSGWDTSVHKNSAASWNNVPPKPWAHTRWTNVADNACENCHNPHNALGRKRLLNYSADDDNCVTCHNGNVAHKNIVAELNKASRHSFLIHAGMHDPTEGIVSGTKWHVVCVDCHNPHAAADAPSGNLPGALNKVNGVNAQGIAIDEITNEYELCFRCHADTDFAARVYVNRQYPEVNMRRAFDPANRSFHPIETIGKNPDVPSLIAPLATSSIIKCTDCHNNDSGPNNGGTGPKGPHGSIYRPLLERNLNFAETRPETFNAYQLCYKCHDRNSIMQDRSFQLHSYHIQIGAACTVCHDPHGVKNAAHLINFDRNVVSPDSLGRISFTDYGRFTGECSLTCHGSEHRNRGYPVDPNDL